MSGNIYDNLAFFQGLEAPESADLRALFVLCHEPAGSILFDQGDLAEHLYLLAEGEVNVRYKPDDGPVLILARVRPEGVIGWSAAMGSARYTSSAVCSSDCELLRVSGEDLRNFCETHPAIGPVILDRLAEMIAERLRNTRPFVINLLRQGLNLPQDTSLAVG